MELEWIDDQGDGHMVEVDYVTGATFNSMGQPVWGCLSWWIVSVDGEKPDPKLDEKISNEFDGFIWEQISEHVS